MLLAWSGYEKRYFFSCRQCIEFLTLYHVNFYDFLLAQNELLAKELQKSSLSDSVWKTFRNELLEKY